MNDFLKSLLALSLLMAPIAGSGMAYANQPTFNDRMAAEPILNTFLDLVRLPSPSGQEEPVREYLEQRFQRLNIPKQPQLEFQHPNYTVDPMGNLLLYLPANQAQSNRTLLIDTHMDVVPPCINIVPLIQIDNTLAGENRVVHTSGDTVLGGDDKAAIAPLVEALSHSLKTNLPRPNLILLFTVQEEMGGLGAKAIDHKLLSKADLILSLDINGAQGTVVDQAPQLTLWHAEIQGKRAHAGIEPEKGINALKAAAIAVSKLKLGRLDTDTTFNVGTFQSGEKYNIIPSQAKLDGDVRSFSAHKIDQQLALLNQVLQDSTQQVPGTTYQLHQETWIQGYHSNLSQPIFSPLKQALQDTGLPLLPTQTLGGSDYNIFAPSGIPGAVLSAAYNNPHQTNEFVRVQDLQTEATLLLNIWKQYAF